MTKLDRKFQPELSTTPETDSDQANRINQIKRQEMSRDVALNFARLIVADFESDEIPEYIE